MTAEGRRIWVAMVLLGCCGCAATPAPRAPDGPAVRVMTYNVNFGSDPTTAAELIRRGGADVVCLQESTPAYEAYLRENLSGLHQELWFHAGGCRSWLIVTRNTRTHEISDVKFAQRVGEA